MTNATMPKIEVGRDTREEYIRGVIGLRESRTRDHDRDKGETMSRWQGKKITMKER